MTDSDVQTVLRLMGVEPRGRSVPCVLAPWTHAKGRDTHPSASVKNQGIALYNCLACHNGGTLRKIAFLYFKYSGDQRAYDYIKKVEPTNLKDSLLSSESYEESLKRLAKSKNTYQKEKKKIIYGEEHLQEFKKLVPYYAKERGLTREDVITWEIGFDQQRNRMTFAIRDYLGNLMGFSGRDVTGEAKPKYWHYTGLTKEAVFYGENKLDRSSTRVYIVEGFFDTIMLYRQGIKNVFCTMGTSISEYQIEKMKRWFNEVVFIPDGDKEGLKFAESYAFSLLFKMKRVGIACVKKNESYIKRRKPLVLEDCDFRYLLNEDYVGKDPSDLAGDKLRDVLNHIEWCDLTELSD